MKYIIPFLCCCIATVITDAQPGTLDYNFGMEGRTLFKGQYLGCNAMALQGDGKIVQAGRGTLHGVNGFFLVRINNDGSPDLDFGDSGRVVTDISPTSDYTERIISLAVQADGRIVAAGTVFNEDIALACYMPDGSVDSSFGTDGIVITKIRRYNYLSSVAIQPDGKIVVTGITQEDENDTKTSFTIRYNDDGSFDENFGDHGTVLTLYSQVVEINSIALQQDGKILIGGDYPFTAPAGKFLVVRYMPKGSLDNSFGINGRSSILIAPNGGYSYASSIAVQPDGKIITTGTSENSSGQSMTLVRFKEDGSIDASFGDGDGIVVTQFAEKNLEGIKVLIQPDRKILCAGRYFDNISLSNFALARYKTNGDLDSTFGINGLQITDMGGESTCAGAALQPDGKIIVAGDTYKYDPVDPTYSSSYVLARYYGGDVVMPITYNHFNAIQNQQYITLNWQTATELSNKHFAVERGNDAISFTSIADVSGAGSSTATHDYYYTDKLPVQGTNYYRLKQIDADGKFSYSKTVSIGFLKPGSIQLFPNPAKEQLTVKGLNAAVTSTIAVLDIQGKELLKFKAKASTYSFSISSLAAGTYMVSVKDDNGIAVQKFVKQ